MEQFITFAVTVVLLETTYLFYKQVRTTSISHRGDVLIDTSVLIDGRILAIARSGLLSSRLIIPQSVVRELQFMADRADHDKRERARYGLDVIEKLQQLPLLTVEVANDGTTSEHGVDEQLIVLAKRSGAKLCTIDYNLNKAARVQSVEVININELAHALRVNHLPGEKISVELVQPGQDKKQGVGYLDDGTMVVVEDSRDFIGKSVAVELTRVLQTAAGRMMFARRINTEPAPRSAPPSTAKGRSAAAPRDKAKIRTVPHAAQPRVETDTTETPKKQSGRRRPAGNRRQSPEDTLVDLANK